MKKRNYLLLIVATVLFANTAFTQISTRRNDSVNVKLGARPVAGDMALVFAYPIFTSVDSFSFKIHNMLQNSNFLTVKYYLHDDLVLRAGLKLYKSSLKSKGDIADTNAIIGMSTDSMSSNSLKNSKREYCIALGLEKHFSGSNIFDVYMGGDLYAGLGRDITIEDYEYKFQKNTPSDFENIEKKTKTSIFGFAGVIGVNIFIAQLPVSVGLEYGLNAKWTLGGKTKVTQDQVVNGKASSAEYYTQGNDPFGVADNNKYKTLKKGQFNMDTNHDVRIVLHVYFK
ncbi:MAG: hypothetical protein WC223_08125 [Bacteroidales bacterium]|jgi:hypothetical protein